MRTATGARDAFVVKLDANGNQLFAKRYGGDFSATAAAVRVDGAGNVAVLGDFSGAIDFGGASPLASTSSSQDIFVVKLDPSGKHLWSKRFGDGSKRQNASALAVDAAGNLLIGCTFEGVLNFGGQDLTSPGYPTPGATNIAVAKLGPDGKHLFSHTYGDTSGQGISAVAFDAAGAALLAGQLRGDVNFGGATFSATSTKMYVTKLDTSGAHVFSRMYGAAGDYLLGGIAADRGDVVLAGRFWGALDLGAGALSAPDADYEIFVARIPGK